MSFLGSFTKKRNNKIYIVNRRSTRKIIPKPITPITPPPIIKLPTPTPIEPRPIRQPTPPITPIPVCPTGQIINRRTGKCDTPIPIRIFPSPIIRDPRYRIEIDPCESLFSAKACGNRGRFLPIGSPEPPLPRSIGIPFAERVERVTEDKIIPAKHGFHGYVNKPTKFLVGESGRERVDISPVKKRKSNANVFDFDFGGGMFK